MTNKYDQAVNFVAAMPDTVTIEPARADLVRRQDVVNVVDRMIDGYMTQQSALLDSVTGETVQGRGFLSDAGQVAERRKTSRMYLFYYTLITGMVSGGLVLLAHGAGYLDAGGSFSSWLALTGGLALWLGWKRHGDELVLTPESIALRVVDAHENVALYESETRRLAIEWEHAAEGRRQAAQERAAEHGRQLAQLRVDELDARRRAIEAQRAQVDPWRTESPQTLQDGAGRTQAALQVQSIDDDAETPTDGTAGDSWQAALLQWVVTLYEPGNMTADGIIRQRAPWAARSAWVESDKAAARRVCCEMYPKLIEPAAGGQWRLRREMFTDADQALQVVSPRLS
jgi:hypothetical protein